jgi:hypothetical protein
MGLFLNLCDSVYKEVTMSHWNIAAAQYGGLHQTVDDHVTHHLRFIAEAARQGCDLLVFPELSLTGSGTTTLPLPPGDAQLEPLLDAAHRYRITVIAGLPVERMVSARKVSRSSPRSSTHPSLPARWRSQPGAGRETA